MVPWGFFVGRKSCWREVQEWVSCQTHRQFQGLLVLCLSGQGKEELTAEPSLGGMAPRKKCTSGESCTFSADSSGSRAAFKTHSSELAWTPSGSAWDGNMSINKVLTVFSNSKFFSQVKLHPEISLFYPRQVPDFVFVIILTVSFWKTFLVFLYFSHFTQFIRLTICVIFHLCSLGLVTPVPLVVAKSSKLQASYLFK